MFAYDATACHDLRHAARIWCWKEASLDIHNIPAIAFVGLASWVLACCGNPSADSRAAIGTRAIASDDQITQAYPSPSDVKKLAAAEFFESLTLAAATAPEAKLDTMIAAARTEEKKIHSLMSANAMVSVTANLGEIAAARRSLNRTDIAIASVEIYRSLVTDLSRKGTVPTAVNLLDYCGFLYSANLEAKPVRWSEMAVAVGIADAEWKGLETRISNISLRARFGQVLRDMNGAASQRDPAIAAKSVKLELDLVGELERQFPVPKEHAKT